MRRTTTILALLTLSLGAAAPRAQADPIGAAMADAASRFLAALDEGQKARAAHAFDSPERTNWHWIPRERKGVPIKELAPEQRALAFGLLGTGLSTKGAVRATTIMSLEAILREAEHGTGPVRDPELYFVSVFGTPGDTGDWGWRIEGHHLALNYTLKDGKVASATPFMFGSNPAVVKSGPRKGLRNMADIEEPANALLLSLSDEQKKAAIVSADVPDVTVNTNSAQPEPKTPIGISAQQLDGDQRKLLTQIQTAYFANFPNAVTVEFMNQVVAHGREYPPHFAWYGPADPTKPHAFVVQGPTLYIDFNQKQDAANHIHSWFRSLTGDFGVPLH